MSTRSRKKIVQQKGYAAIVSVLILMGVSLVVVSGLAVTMLINLRVAENSVRGMRAFQVAEVGLERITAEWIEDPTPTAGTIYADQTFWLDSETSLGTYTVEVVDLGNGKWQIDSTGINNDVYRRVRATVLVSLSGPHSSYQKAVFANSSFDIPSGSEIWGDVYVNGLPAFDNGFVYGTNDSGEHFGYNPTLIEAPYGKLVYYYSDPADVWQHVEPPTATTAGDAHGFWTSGQEVKQESTWVNPQHNTGDPDHSDSGQYWNRNGGGAEYLNTSTKSLYEEYSGIAIKDSSTPENFPTIGNGSYSNFVAEYNASAPQETKYDNLAICTNNDCSSTIVLADYANTDIIGTEQNGNGFPMQFNWTGTADPGYSGALIFEDDYLLYIDGDISISGDVGLEAEVGTCGHSLTVVSSGQVDINANQQIPPENFSIIAYENINVNTDKDMNGVYFTGATLTLDSNPDVYGILIAGGLDLVGGATRITYVADNIFKVSQWLPGGSSPTVQLISWNEVGLE